MIEIFRTNQFFATLLLIPYTLLIRINSLINAEAYQVQEYDSPFVKYLFSELLTSPILQSLLASIIVFLTANFINRLVIQNRLSKFLTLIPGLFFILITAGMPSGMFLSPALLSVFFVLSALLNMYRTYKNRDSATHIFNAGLYFGIATIIYPSHIFFWAFGVIALLNLRSFKISEMIIYISGYFVPLFLLGTYYYWNNKLDLIYDYFQFDKGILSIFSDLSYEVLFHIAAIGIVVVYTIVRYNSFMMKSTIQVQKKVDIVYWFMLFCLLNMFFSNGISLTHMVVLAIPFSIFVGLSFEKVKSNLMAEMIHVGFIVAVLFSQFQNFF